MRNASTSICVNLPNRQSAESSARRGGGKKNILTLVFVAARPAYVYTVTMFKIENKTRYITHAALIAAGYAALTIGLAPISFGQQQLRVAEAMAVLPAFTPAAVPGLFIGCAISNTVSFLGLPDLIFGSLATLLSALLTSYAARALKDSGLALRALVLPMPAVIINAAVIGAMLSVLADIPFIAAAAGVLAGQALSCYGVGAPLYVALDRYMYRKKTR